MLRELRDQIPGTQGRTGNQLSGCSRHETAGWGSHSRVQVQLVECKTGGSFTPLVLLRTKAEGRVVPSYALLGTRERHTAGLAVL